jgi:hypothetical protein
MSGLIAFGLVAACAGKADGIGSYITSDDDAAFMVQIASIEAGHVTGKVSVITSDENGKITAVTRSMSGTIEGDALNLTIENGTGLSVVTGKMDGDNLHLTFFGDGTSSQLTFAKSDVSEFEELAQSKRVRAAEKTHEIESAAALKIRIEQRGKTQRSIDRFADDLFGKAEDAQDRYHGIESVIAGYRVAKARAGKMQSAKRTLNAESQEGSYRIHELDYEINNISNDMRYEHSQVQSFMQSLNQLMADATAKSSQFLAECQTDQLLNCSRLSAGMESLRTQYQQLQSIYTKEQAAYGGDSRNTS